MVKDVGDLEKRVQRVYGDHILELWRIVAEQLWQFRIEFVME